MAIEFKCEHCGKVYKLPEKHAGAKAKCACGHILTVPNPEKPPEASTPVPKPEAAPTTQPQRPEVQKVKPESKPAQKRPIDTAPEQVPARPSEPKPESKPKAASESVPVAGPDIHKESAGDKQPAPAVQEVIYLWDPDPELFARTQEYDAAGQAKSFLCKCGEFLNSVLRTEMFKALKDAEADLRIYSDMAMVTIRQEKPGCMESLLEKSPDWLRTVLRVILFPVVLMFDMPNIIMGIIVLMIAGGIFLFLLFAFPLFTIPAVVVIIGLIWVYDFLERKKLAWIAEKIMNNPKSPYAVKKLYKYSPIVPRIWTRGAKVGEVVGLVRVDTRYKLKQRSLVLVVQDNPFGGDGCMAVGGGLVIGRLIAARRRVYALAFDGGEPAADEAAKQLSNVLGVGISAGAIKMNSLVVRKN